MSCKDLTACCTALKIIAYLHILTFYDRKEEKNIILPKKRN